jgi:hypothetical protein
VSPADRDDRLVVAAAILQRRYLAAPMLCAAALGAGMIATAQPRAALGLVTVAGLVLLMWCTPVAGLGLLLLLLCVVPYGLQNQLGIGGGERSPGLLLSDLLLAAGLIWALLRLASRRLDPRTVRYVALLTGFLLVCVLQFLHGVRAGHDVSRAGQDCRVLLGFGTFLIALPLLHEPARRRRLLITLAALGIALGAWGMVQWFGKVSFGAAGDVGVRPGVRLTSAGSGQLQGGEYGFPVVVVVCFAVLMSGAVRHPGARAALVLAIILNAASCLVTFERTFWLDALLGCAFVLALAPRPQRVRALLAAPLVIVLALAALSLAAPQELRTAQERLLSLGQYSSDASVRYRVVESSFVLDQIRAAPLLGSGLAATIFWGQPWAQVPAKSYAFSHNGYLWLAWRLGVPAAAMLVLMLGSAALLRAGPGADPLSRGLQCGARGALLGLLLASVTFPSFSALSITPAMGVLLALAVWRNPGKLYEQAGRSGGAGHTFAQHS